MGVVLRKAVVMGVTSPVIHTRAAFMQVVKESRYPRYGRSSGAPESPSIGDSSLIVLDAKPPFGKNTKKEYFDFAVDFNNATVKIRKRSRRIRTQNSMAHMLWKNRKQGREKVGAT